MNRFNPATSINGRVMFPMEPHPQGQYVKVNDSTYATPLYTPDDLIGVAEIVRMYGMSKALLCHWHKEAKGFPRPIAILKMGPLFSKTAIRKWMIEHRPLYREKT